MAANYLKTLRKSNIVTIFFTSVLTNLMVFGQPIQQMVTTHYHNKAAALAAKKYKFATSGHIEGTIESDSAPYLYSPGKKESTHKPSGATAAAEMSGTFYAEEKQGTIGKLFAYDAENPLDNFFTISLPGNVDLNRYNATLVYDLYGLAAALHTTKSINNNLSYGGKIAVVANEWVSVKEDIASGQLQPGDNEIFFNRRENENYQYSVRNVRIELHEKHNEDVLLSEGTALNIKGAIYLVGTVSNPAIQHIEAMGKTIPVTNGVFEEVLNDIPKDVSELKISYVKEDGSHSVTFPVTYKQEEAGYRFPQSALESNTRAIVLNQAAQPVSYDALCVSYDGQQLQGQQGTLAIEGLKFKDIKTLNDDINNVTAGNFVGYRVKKSHVADSVALQLHIKYDATRIPEGYTARDIKTFYFDKAQRNWKALPVDSLDLDNKEIISTAFANETDYINGVIKVPESPETGSFAPTTISDMKYADPAAGVVSIQAPSPNSTGTASTSFPIKLPQGRNGMQPSLEVTYNSEAGNGWMGVGWNLSTQAITLNTKWGAPRFDTSKESELYSLNGSELVLKNGSDYTNPHRQDNITRASEREFYQRKEGSYQKIIRHGSSPSNYWWEVIDKHGNKSFYGGYNGVDNTAVIRTAGSTGSIAHWALKRSEDPQGNYIEYFYTKTEAAIGSSAINGQEFYVDKIRYTRHSSLSNYYEVAFKRNSYTVAPAGGSTAFSGRNDAVVSARQGYIQLVDDLLTEVHISLVEAGQAQRIRTYRFDYQEQAFKKQQLIRISEFDTADKLFYSNTLEYYDMTNNGNNTIISSTSASWTGGNDNISSPLQSLPGVSTGIIPNGSPLGTSASSGFSAGLRVGVGIGANPTSVANTVGGSFNYSRSSQDTKVSFIDLNGDGLPDKVYKNTGNIFYRPNTGQGFGDLLPVQGIDELTKVKSRTTGGGVDANALGLIGAGKSWSKTKSETDNYFTDFNGDGLPDMVTGGRVRFNKTVSSDYLYREFDETAALSENPIVSGAVDASIIPYLNLPTMNELREEHPQFDHVKVWQAPYSGYVNIQGQVKLIAKSPGSQSNIFKVSIEKANFNQSGNLATVLQSYSSLQTVNQTYTFTGVSNVQVAKGDILFFRIHNRDYGYGGEIEWNPVITYNNMSVMPYTTHNDESGKAINVFSSQDDYIMNNDMGAGANGATTINFNLLDTSFDPYQFSDDIVFTVKKVRINLTDGTESVISTTTRTYSHTSGNFSGPSTISVGTPPSSNYRDVFHFYAESDSNVEWDAINWKPTMTGAPSGTYYPPVNYYVYDNNVNQSKYWFNASQLIYPTINSDPNSAFMEISHDFFSQNYTSVLDQFEADEFPLRVSWVVKEEIGTTVKRLHKRTFLVHRLNEVFPGLWDYKFTTTTNVELTSSDVAYSKYNFTKQKIKDIKDGNGRIYSALYISNSKIGAGNDTDITLKLHSTQENNYTFTPVELYKPFHALTPTFFGISYRGWGQFLYNGGLEFERDEEGNITNPNSPAIFGNQAIDISLFDFEGQADGMENVDPNTNPEDVEAEGTSIRYTFYNEDNQNNKFVNEAIIDAIYGFNTGGKLTAKVGRFAEANLHDIYINPNTITLGGSGIFVGMKQRSESKGSAVSGNLGYVSGTDSEATSNVLNQYLDLNGDRYPDMITGGTIQYTNMLGGLANVGSNSGFVAGDESQDITVGASIPSIQPKSTESSNGKTTGGKTNTSVSSGINVSDGKSFNSRQWADMNGDGLADKVRINGSNVEVWLNTGYGFTEQIIWGSGYSDLLSSERNNASIGPSFSFSPSFAGGFGAAASTAKMNSAVIDVNGDGLPDLVVKSGSSYKYYLNTGEGFASTQNTFYGSSVIDEDYTVSGNVFGSATFGFTIPLFIIILKVVFSPSAGGNASYNEKTATVQDIDGDGLSDVIFKGSSTNNTAISARLNTVGKTHLLKKVNTPLGGSWTIDYVRDGNTYDLPQNKWVLNKIQTHDGFTADNDYKPDATLITVSYANPKYDRREREFLGYGEVFIEQKDPGTQNLYRTIKKSYHNENYYLSGAEKGNTLYNASGQVLSEDTTLYNLLDPDSPVVNPDAVSFTHYLQASLTANAEALLDKSRLFIAVARVTSTSYEGGQGLTAVKEFTNYDNNGNVTTYIDQGEGADDAYKTVIEYHLYTYFTGVTNGTGFPERISVYNNSTSQLLRQRSATYYSTGKLKQVTTKLNSSENNRVSFAYDTYGNLIKVNDLDNLNEQGTTYYVQDISYDTTLRTYPVTFSNSFGESSSTQYNYLFGIPVFTTDMNNQSMRTRIDNRGRIVEVTGPNELAVSSTGWTIRMQYKGESTSWTVASNGMRMADGNFPAVNPGAATPAASQHYAVTRHFDPEIANNQLLTISISDGFGQAIQIKKTHKTGATMKWLVSGFETKDAFGRRLKSYLPAVQTSYPTNLNSIPSTSLNYYDLSPGSLPAPVEMTYDEKDRVKTVKQPGETQTTQINFEVEDGMFAQKVTNELSQTIDTYTDIRGRMRQTIQNGEITTALEYNSINELMRVIDNEGFITSYIYDMAGRNIEMQHPDRGVITFKYDKAGRKTEQSNSNLLLDGGLKINYFYDFRRLIRIEYPQNPQNQVKYTYGEPGDPLAVSENAVGRLLYEEDASGIQIFGYGRMGEVTKNLRSVAVAGYQSYWFYTKWTYDSWNRIQEITYPDQERVSYIYDNAGKLYSIKSQMNGISTVQDVVTSITYNDYGERSTIVYGNGTKTDYDYDLRRRMNVLEHTFNSFGITKNYQYDVLSNIKGITTASPQNSLPGAGQIGGPVNHLYEYDDYNRLVHAEGNYTGPNDISMPYVRQEYTLDMEYNTDHTIKRKTQFQRQGLVSSYGGVLNSEAIVFKNSYELNYSDYATGAFVAGPNSYGYQQPHAPRTIVESPSWANTAPDDPRVKHKEISYDANGNQTEIKEIVGEMETKLRRNLWDEENRLRAVDLKPDEATNHPIAIYTYNAAGERVVRYNYDRIDVASNATEVGEETRDNVMMYPSGLLMGKAIHTNDRKLVNRIIYTKHYYAGTERMSAKTGTIKELGLYPSTWMAAEMPQLNTTAIRSASTATVNEAGATVTTVFSTFSLTPPALQPVIEDVITTFRHDPTMLNIYYFHPDHLGSSSYITNAAGIVTQHMEYLPFGETLIDEHTNSFNSPFKFNGKEFDEETGNYYYSARYYDPKWSIWLSVDPLAEKYPDWSPYAYTYNNPIRYIDPTGMEGDDWYQRTNECGDVEYKWFDGASESCVDDNGVTWERKGVSFAEVVTSSSDENPEGNKGVNIYTPEGNIDFISSNENGMVELPESGYGYDTYNRNDVDGNQDQWGKPEVIAGLLNSIAEYKECYADDIISIGDMKSPSNGQTFVRKGKYHHADNGAVDIRLLGPNGSYQGTISDSRFSVEKTQAFINALGNNGVFSRFIIGSSVSGKFQGWGSISVKGDKTTTHNNHYHIDLK